MHYLWAFLLLFAVACSDGGTDANDDSNNSNPDPEQPIPPTPDESISEDELLDKVQMGCFNFFWDAYDEKTGLSRNALGTSPFNENDWRTFTASTTSIGWGLSALCLADTHGWKPKTEVYNRVLKTLNAIYDDPDDPDDPCLVGKWGAYYSAYNMRNLKPANDEVSTTGLGLMMCGVLHAMEHFKGTEVEEIARKIYLAAQWDKFIAEDGVVTAGFYTGDNTFRGRFPMYNEYIIFYLLGLGSPTYPLPDKCWEGWNSGNGSKPVCPYPEAGEYYYAGFGEWFNPLAYIYQMPANWFDFRGKKDKKGIDYWDMSINALKTNKIHCERFAKNHGKRDGLWGWTACPIRDGYQRYGLEYKGFVSPSAVAASLPYIPDAAMKTLRLMYEKYGDMIFHERYGFVESFNFTTDKWIDNTFLGLDCGNMLLMIENYRNEGVWKETMKNEFIQKGMERAGFVKYKDVK